MPVTVGVIVCEPLQGTEPVHALSAGLALAVQPVAPDVATVSVSVCPAVIVVDDAVSDAVGAVAVIVTVADADFVESAALVAVTVAEAGFGTAEGAV